MNQNRREYQKEWERTHKDARALIRHRRRAIHKLEWMRVIKEHGLAKCSQCGYEKCFRAIDFHHIDPATKEWNISYLMQHTSPDKYVNELDKVIALCANCHRELHGLD